MPGVQLVPQWAVGETGFEPSPQFLLVARAVCGIVAVMQRRPLFARLPVVLLLAACDSGESAEVICAELEQGARAERSAALALAASGTCSADRDCALASSHLACADGGGPVAIRQDAQATFETELRSIENDRCAEFAERRCRNGSKSAPPTSMPVPICRAGSCDV